MKKAMIFDLDGTLLNTLEDLYNAVNHALSTYNYPKVSINEVRSALGNGPHKLIESCLKKEVENFDEVFDTYLSYYSSHSKDGTTYYDGVPETLNALKSKGIKLAVLSNKQHQDTLKIIDNYFPNTFDIVQGSTRMYTRKPNPENLLKIVSELQVDITECVYIGDTEVDYLTAKNANMDCLMVKYGFRNYEYLVKQGCPDEIFINSFPDLLTQY